MISIIVALANNGVIGNKGEIPWHLPDDLKYFAKITKDHTVIMGRKTYESIIKKLGRPLPDRRNVVITSQQNFEAPGCVILQSVNEAIGMYSLKEDEVFVIGGGEIYKQFMPIATRLYITEVYADCDGDTVFPPYDKTKWTISLGKHHPKDDKHAYSFAHTEYVRCGQ